MEDAELSEVDLTEAALVQAHFERANLTRAKLSGADLSEAHLEGADLTNAHLGARKTTRGIVPPANLQEASLDASCRLRGIELGTRTEGSVLLADVRWNGANLSLIDWRQVRRVGEERQRISMREAKETIESALPFLSREWQAKGSLWLRILHTVVRGLFLLGLPSIMFEMRVEERSAAVRASRQLAVVLRAQGLNEVADRFAYRAHVLQRQVLRLQGRFLPYFGSLLLGVVSGYGYKPMRSVITYLVVILSFAIVYYLIGHASGVIPGPVDAVVFSLTSFHGRGFFPSEKVSLHSPVIVIAATEAVIGLLIEISFIATFTQRFFGR